VAGRSNGNLLVLTGIGLVGALLLVAAFAGGLFDPAPRPLGKIELASNQTPKPTPPTAPKLNEALGIDESELVEVGGIKRPKRDIAFSKSATEKQDDSAEPVSDPFEKSLFRHPGSAPKVPADANPQVAGLYASLTDPEGSRAARSALFEPEPFDLTAYQEDPSGWLDQIRPGRVFQPAKPADSVEPIKNQSPIFHHVVQGERVNLEVKVSPGMPVTFYTPKVGEFPNRLTTHSVAADSEGIARTVYLAGPGTKGIVDIMAASPVHSGVLRYKVRVSLPD
jgi:hypothetical protein